MLTFDDDSHTYAWKGLPVPGVTTILKPASAGFDAIPPAVIRKARDRGVAVHRAIELYEKGTLNWETLHPEILPYLLQWQRFVEESRCELLSTETRVYHPLYGYAGTMDLRLKINGRLAVVDTKASWAIPVSTGPQTAAYASAYEAEHGAPHHDRYALHLRKDRYRLEELTDHRDAGVFLSCLSIWRFRNEHRLEQGY